MFFIEFAGLLSEVTDSIIEAGGCGVAEVFAELFELSFGACAFGDGFRESSFVHGLRGPLDVAAGFLHLLLNLLLFLAVLRFLVLCIAGLLLLLLHAFIEFVDVAEHFALFVAESFEFAFEFFAFLIGACCAEFGFELFEAFVDHLLSAREFLESVEDLELFALLAVSFLLLLSLAFGFVAIAIVIQFELLELLLGGAVSAATAALLLLLLLAHLKFGGAHFQQRLQGSLFGGEGRSGFCCGIISGCIDCFSSSLHFLLGAFCECIELGSLRGFFERLPELFDGLSLGLGDGGKIFVKRSGVAAGGLVPGDIPGG